MAGATPPERPLIPSGGVPGPRGTTLRPVRFAAGRLAGIVHGPADRAPERVGVICPPLFFEYQLCHRTLRALADRLAGQGGLVLRLDYTGTGDSLDEAHDQRLALWESDVAAGLELVRADAGPLPSFLVGLRAGATLALRVAATVGAGGNDDAAPRVFSWSPILDGPAYVESLERAHAGWYERYRGHHRRHADPSSETGRLLGHPFPPELATELASLGPPGAIPTPVVLVETAGHELGRPERDAVERVANELDVLAVDPPAPWLESPDAVSPPVPAKGIDRLAGAIRERLRP